MLVSKYGHTATLGKFMFGHGRFLGVHNPLSSNVRKAEDPFINNWTLRRLSRSDDLIVRNLVVDQLVMRIGSGTISVERLTAVHKAIRDQAFMSLPDTSIAEPYLSAGIVPKDACKSIMMNPRVEHQRKEAAFYPIKSIISDSEILGIVESLDSGSPLLALLSFADFAGKKTLMRIIEKSPRDCANAFNRLSGKLSEGDITYIFGICKDILVMDEIAAHPKTPLTILWDIALKNKPAKASDEGMRKAQARVPYHYVQEVNLEKLFAAANSVYILGLIKDQPNASPDLKARCDKRIAEKGK
ncbi:MAG: hypothetical protein NTZ10_01045 [Candidatus Saganbacteria bacterium]|nr:hypothetical protein [Candidatus Saganbacteria bacterium]